MASLDIGMAQRIADELRAIPAVEYGMVDAEIRLRVSECGDTARVSLTLRDPRSGNAVYREADGTDALSMVRDAVREMRTRAGATRRRIAAERRAT